MVMIFFDFESQTQYSPKFSAEIYPSGVLSLFFQFQKMIVNICPSDSENSQGEIAD